MIMEVMDGIRYTRRKEKRCLFCQGGKMKSCNYSLPDYYIKKSRPACSSVQKQSGNMFTISMKNYRWVTGWKPSINISGEPEGISRNLVPYHFSSSLLLFRFTSAIRWEASIS